METKPSATTSTKSTPSTDDRLSVIEDALRAVNILPALPPEDDSDNSR